MSEREKTLQQKRAELRTTEDDVIRMKKDLEKRMAQVKRAAKSESSNSKGSVLDHHADNAIVSPFLWFSTSSTVGVPLETRQLLHLSRETSKHNYHEVSA